MYSCHSKVSVTPLRRSSRWTCPHSGTARPAVGEAAPDFTLPDDAGSSQSLSAQRGRWVVLFFYPKDFTPGCTNEVCDFRDLSTEFDALGATVWSVSAPTSFRHCSCSSCAKPGSSCRLA